MPLMPRDRPGVRNELVAAAARKKVRCGLGYRQHSVTLRDMDMVIVMRRWLRETSCGDNPTMWDAIRLRAMLAERTGQDLSMLCLFWLRNEMVALRKACRLTARGLHDGKG